jgi:hypothetical protein
MLGLSPVRAQTSTIYVFANWRSDISVIDECWAGIQKSVLLYFRPVHI